MIGVVKGFRVFFFWGGGLRDLGFLGVWQLEDLRNFWSVVAGCGGWWAYEGLGHSFLKPRSCFESCGATSCLFVIRLSVCDLSCVQVWGLWVI